MSGLIRIVRPVGLPWRPLKLRLEELAQSFHSLWTVGTREGIKLIDPLNEELSLKRMFMVTALKNTIANGLQTIGVTPKDVMEARSDL